MADEVAIFEAAVKDETDKFWQRMERRFGETETKGGKAFKLIEDRIRRVGQAAGETANSRTKGLAAVIAKGNLMSSTIKKGLDILITSFVRLAEAGVQALARILEKGNEINKNLEVSERTFASVFGDPQLGKETVQFLSRVSRQLGINRAQAIDFARSILPRTESTEQFTRVLELTEAQARATGVSLDDLGFSVREALAGDPNLLRDRFDLERSQIAKIKELSTEIGAAGAFVEVVGEALEKRGIANLEDFADTGAAVRLSFAAMADELTAAFAQPIFEQQTESLQELTAAIDEDKDLLVSILQNISAVGAKTIQVLTDAALAFRENVDLEKIQKLSEGFDELFDSVIFFVDAVIGGAEGAGESIDSLTDASIRLVDVLTKTAVEAGKVGTQIRIVTSTAVDLIQAYNALRKGKAVDFFKNIKEVTEGPLFNQEQMTKEIGKTESAYDRYNRRLEENKKRQEERAKAAKDAATVDVEGLDAALKGLNKAEAKATEAQEAVLKLQQSLTKRFVEDQIKESRRIVDAEIKESRRREDIARDSTKDLDKIEEDAAESRAKAFAKFAKDVPEFEKKASEERRKVRNESRDKDIESERKYRQRLRDIQTDFERSSRDAALENDIAAFIDAKIQRQDAIKDAKKDRGSEQSEIKSEGQAKVDELRKKLSEERKALDADLRERLSKIDESAVEQVARQAEQLREQEEAHKISLERQAEDDVLATTRKEEDLKRSLNEQLAAIEANQGDIEGVTADSLTAQAQGYADAFGPGGSIDTTMTEFFSLQAEKLDEMARQTAALEEQTRATQKAAADQEAKGKPIFTPGKTPLVKLTGQGGLVSQFLSSPRMSIPSAKTSTSTQNINTRNESSVSMDLRGAEPLIQRIAARTALEIVQNVAAGG